jgi:hypothetical protein
MSWYSAVPASPAGRAVVDAALDRGDTVTLFNRGKTNPGLYPEAETIIGDRTGDLSALSARRWDAVVDVAAYDPEIVRRSAQALADAAGRAHRRPARPDRPVRLLATADRARRPDPRTRRPGRSAAVHRRPGPGRVDHRGAGGDCAECST